MLADGREWLLAIPSYHPGSPSLTFPNIDGATDRLFEGIVSQSTLSLTDIWEVAMALLQCNYELKNEEISELLSVSEGEEEARLKQAILELIFGSSVKRKGYGLWVRASLLANGLGGSTISADELPEVMSILVATHRTIPLTHFADVCRDAQVRESLDILV